MLSIIDFTTLKNVFDLTGNGIPKKFDESKHALMYTVTLSDDGKPKMGQTTRIGGKTYQEAMIDRYTQAASSRDTPIYLLYLYLIPRRPGAGIDYNYDTDFRNRINMMHKLHPNKYKQYCPHDHGDAEFENTERIENWNIDDKKELNLIHELMRVWVDSYTKGDRNIIFNDERVAVKFRGAMQAQNFSDAQDIVRTHYKVLINGHTSDGKSYLAPKHIVELHKHVAQKQNVGIYGVDGIHIFLTSAVDTQYDIFDNVNAVNYGASITVITNDDLKQEGFEEKLRGYMKNSIVFCVFTIQNLRYNEDKTDNALPKQTIIDVKRELRSKFKFLKNFNIISLTRDERHKEYDALITRHAVSHIDRTYTFDLSATITDLLKRYGDLYEECQIVRNPLSNMLSLTKSGHPEYKGYITELYIEMANFNSDAISEKLKNVFNNYTSKSLYKLNPNTMKFELEEELKEYHRLLYDGVYDPITGKIRRNKIENPFAVYSDSELLNTDVILHMLPRGEGGYSATDIIDTLVKFSRGENQYIRYRDYYTADEIKGMMGKGFKSNEKILLGLVDVAKSKGKDGIVILTHRKLILGVNLPPLSIIVCDDVINSVVVFEQLLGRAVRMFLGILHKYYFKNAAKIYMNHPGITLKTIGAMKHQILKASIKDENELKRVSEDILPISYYDVTKKQVTFEEQFQSYQENLYNKFVDSDFLSVGGIVTGFPEIESLLAEYDLDEHIKNVVEHADGLQLTEKLKDLKKSPGVSSNKRGKETSVKKHSKNVETFVAIVNEMIYSEVKRLLIERGEFK